MYHFLLTFPQKNNFFHRIPGISYLLNPCRVPVFEWSISLFMFNPWTGLGRFAIIVYSCSTPGRGWVVLTTSFAIRHKNQTDTYHHNHHETASEYVTPHGVHEVYLHAFYKHFTPNGVFIQLINLILWRWPTELLVDKTIFWWIVLRKARNIRQNAQPLNYLKATGLLLGIILNSSHVKIKNKRLGHL